MTQEETWLLNEKYHGEVTPAFFTDCARLAAGEPLAYLIGSIPFLGAQISLDTKPLIPRPETELWVSDFLASRQARLTTGESRILDLCAGSGCIGVAVLLEYPASRVDFVEIDQKHHSTITKNIKLNGLSVRPGQVLGGHLFSQVTEKYHFILTNPPYVDISLGRLASSVVNYEPELALDGGRHGLALIAEIINQAPDHLFSAGELWLEHEPEQ